MMLGPGSVMNFAWLKGRRARQDVCAVSNLTLGDCEEGRPHRERDDH